MPIGGFDVVSGTRATIMGPINENALTIDMRSMIIGSLAIGRPNVLMGTFAGFSELIRRTAKRGFEHSCHAIARTAGKHHIGRHVCALPRRPTVLSDNENTRIGRHTLKNELSSIENILSSQKNIASGHALTASTVVIIQLRPLQNRPSSPFLMTNLLADNLSVVCLNSMSA